MYTFDLSRRYNVTFSVGVVKLAVSKSLFQAKVRDPALKHETSNPLTTVYSARNLKCMRDTNQHQYNYTYGTRTITQTSKDVKCIMKLAAGVNFSEGYNILRYQHH